MGLDIRAVETKAEDTEFFYWRSHYRLREWIRQRFFSPRLPDDAFNEFMYYVGITLTPNDIDSLDEAISHNLLPEHEYNTEHPDIAPLERDLDFIEQARSRFDRGLDVKLYASW